MIIDPAAGSKIGWHCAADPSYAGSSGAARRSALMEHTLCAFTTL